MWSKSARRRVINASENLYEFSSFERLTGLFRSAIIRGVVGSSLAAPRVVSEELQIYLQMSIILIVLV